MVTESMTNSRRQGDAQPSGTRGTTVEESIGRVITRRAGQLVALPLIGLIRVYQLVISPLTPPTCRYYPSCSAYAVTSLRRFGPIKGTWLAVRRVLRCHPWAPGGVDHVPERAPKGIAAASTASGPEVSDPGLAGSDPEPRASTDSRSAERPIDPQG